MDWITDNIAIGNFVDAKNPDPSVDFILCLKPDCCKTQTNIETVHIPLVDGSGNNPALYRKALYELTLAVSEGKRILVHCHAGRSRSVAIVAKYLMESKAITADDALTIIRQKREICLTQGIEKIFEEDPSRTRKSTIQFRRP